MRPLASLSLLFALCLLAAPASAGRLFGDIKLDGKPLPAGIPVKIALAAPPAAPGAPAPAAPTLADSTVTDKFGSYKLTVKGEGKCILTLIYEKRPITLEVFSYNDATRYDLILANANGVFTLRRK
jgi:hypothetical protein